MKIPIDEIYLNCRFEKVSLKEKIPILFLHGFTGSHKDWEFIIGRIPEKFTPIFIDLLGHGNSASPEDSNYYSQKNQVNYLLKIVDYLQLKKFVLVGYSMGGRLAASFAVKYPRRISALILESASFGIKNDVERVLRTKADQKLAEMIMHEGIAEFIQYWYSIPLFQTLKNLPAEKFEQLIHRRIISNNQTGLENSLIGFSAGKMDYLIPDLSKVRSPVLYISGSEDKKYADIGKKIISEYPNWEFNMLKNCGHNVHFELPEEFLKLLNSFLSNI